MQIQTFEFNANCSNEESAFVRNVPGNVPGPNEMAVAEDPRLAKLRSSIDGYSERIASWQQTVKHLASKQNAPTPSTVGIFALGTLLCLAINVFALISNGSALEIAYTNLGCLAIWIVGAVSLFYDRIVRGFGRELALRLSADQASEIAIQVHALSAMQLDLQYRNQRLRREASELSDDIETRRQRVVDLDHSIATATSQYEDCEARLSELRREVMSEAGRLSRCQYSVNHLRHEEEELQLSIQAHTERLFDIAAQRENVSSELASMEKSLAATRAALASEQQQREMETQRSRDHLRSLAAERSAARADIESLQEDMRSLQERRDEMHAELELIRSEQERKTVASLAAIAELQQEIQSLEIQRDHARDQFDHIAGKLESATMQHENLLSRIAESANEKQNLDKRVDDLMAQLNDSENALKAVQTAIVREEVRLTERQAQADKEAADADAKQRERNRMLQELDRGIGSATQERDALEREISRLSGVKEAMELSIDELTHRLELRTTELRRKHHQLQEQAERLERLSEAIERLVARESEVRQSQAIADNSNIGPLNAIHAPMRSLHGPHFNGTFRPANGPANANSIAAANGIAADDFIEG